MSDKWLNVQHDETRNRNRERRLAEMAEAQRQAEARNAARQTT